VPYINRSTVMGHAGSDAEIRYTANGSAVLNMSIATTRKWKDRETGDQREDTQWHRIVAWGKKAEWSAKICKGDLVYVDGRLQTRQWEKDGVTQYTTEIVADNIYGLTKHEPGDDHTAEQSPDGGDDSGDIPF